MRKVDAGWKLGRKIIVLKDVGLVVELEQVSWYHIMAQV